MGYQLWISPQTGIRRKGTTFKELQTLFIDQITRPYYRPDLAENELEHVLSQKDSNVEKPRQYFDFLFKEVQNQQGLQIIVLEHAYFEDDPRYVKATKDRWINGKKLVPTDWPKAV